MVESVSYLSKWLVIANEESSQVFPLYSDIERLPSKNSALAWIHAKCMEYNKRNTDAVDGSDWLPSLMAYLAYPMDLSPHRHLYNLAILFDS